MSASATDLTPARIFANITAFQRTAALRAGIELEVFTAIGGGAHTVGDIAKKTAADQRGVRILCDMLTVMEFLGKSAGGEYSLTAESAAFLDKRSPAYLGSISVFLNSEQHTRAFARFTEAVRKGSTALTDNDVLAPENPTWVTFAQAMAPMMFPPSQGIAAIMTGGKAQPMRVLDIAAGHGLFGLAFAQANPKAEITAVDWANVLAVGEENAQRAGLSDRWHKLPGSAFDVDFGTGYDVVLFTNFLHHFDATTNEKLLRKAHAALNPGGRIGVLEFVPNPDRISPPMPAMFAMTMLASTQAGDAYTYAELEKMCRNAGFTKCQRHPLPNSVEELIVATK